MQIDEKVFENLHSANKTRVPLSGRGLQADIR